MSWFLIKTMDIPFDGWKSCLRGETISSDFMPKVRLLVFALLIASFQTTWFDGLIFTCRYFTFLTEDGIYCRCDSHWTILEANRNTFILSVISFFSFDNEYYSLLQYWLFVMFYLQCIAVWLLNSCCPPTFEYPNERHIIETCL